MSPSASLVLAATMLGNRSGSGGMGSQPLSRSSSSDGYSAGSGLAEVGRRGQEGSTDRQVVLPGPVDRGQDAGAVGHDGDRRAGVLDDLVQVGHPTGQVALVPVERGNDDGAGQPGGEPRLPVVLDVPAEARHDDGGV